MVALYAVVTSNKALLLSRSSAWYKYQLDLEQKKKDAMKHTAHSDPKKKGYGWRNSELKRRKLELSTDIDSLTASADQLAEKAESSRAMSIIVK